MLLGEAVTGPSRDLVAVLNLCRTDKPVAELTTAAGRTNRTKLRQQFMRPLLESGLVEMTVPDKPNSRLQKYRLTTAGQDALKFRRT